MDDWRMNGQEKYLSNATLYKVQFPEFWQLAYETKNPFYQKIPQVLPAGGRNGHQLGQEYPGNAVFYDRWLEVIVDNVDIPVISEPIITQTTYERRKTA